MTDTTQTPDANPGLPQLPIDRPVVIFYTETGAPVWLMPSGEVLDDIPLPYLDRDGNEVFE